MGVLVERLEVDSISVEIRRNRRRKTRIGLGFDPSGMVILDAPVDATTEELLSVVTEHGSWLRHRLASVREDAACVGSPQYDSGELLQYLGNAYELDVVSGATRVTRREKEAQLRLFHDVRGIVGYITVSVPKPDHASVKQTLNRWYEGEAKRLFARSVERWRELPWVSEWTPDWRVRFMRSQWGSCSVSGRIALNTHLVKVPERLIDYVVLHELCHLRHHDHSWRFYGLMTATLPDWESRRDELNAYL
ncbi:MAG: M48 family metallopeptidase, partial [Pseudomonadales bacterium]